MTTYLQALDEILDKNNRRNLVCPDCGEEMVKAKYETEEGDWIYVWLCGCKVKDEKKKE